MLMLQELKGMSRVSAKEELRKFEKSKKEEEAVIQDLESWKCLPIETWLSELLELGGLIGTN
jgi:hypothetical protein